MTNYLNPNMYLSSGKHFLRIFFLAQEPILLECNRGERRRDAPRVKDLPAILFCFVNMSDDDSLPGCSSRNAKRRNCEVTSENNMSMPTASSSQHVKERDAEVPSNIDVSMPGECSCVDTPETSHCNTPRSFHELELAKSTIHASGMKNLYVFHCLRLPSSCMRLTQENTEHLSWLKGCNIRTTSPRDKRFILKSGHLMEILDTFDARASTSHDQWLISVSKEQSLNLMFLPGSDKTKEGMRMRKAKWWPKCFERNDICITGIEFGMNFDEGIFRYEPQLPRGHHTTEQEHIWQDRMQQWREWIVMEKQHQFQFHMNSNSPMKVVDWEYPACWQDEPIIVWLKQSNFNRKKNCPQVPDPPQAPIQQSAFQYGMPMPYVLPIYPTWFHYSQ